MMPALNVIASREEDKIVFGQVRAGVQMRHLDGVDAIPNIAVVRKHTRGLVVDERLLARSRPCRIAGEEEVIGIERLGSTRHEIDGDLVQMRFEVCDGIRATGEVAELEAVAAATAS